MASGGSTHWKTVPKNVHTLAIAMFGLEHFVLQKPVKMALPTHSQPAWPTSKDNSASQTTQRAKDVFPCLKWAEASVVVSLTLLWCQLCRNAGQQAQEGGLF